MEVRDGLTVLVQYGENKLPQRIKRDEKERDRDILQAVFDNEKHMCWSFRWPVMSVMAGRWLSLSANGEVPPPPAPIVLDTSEHRAVFCRPTMSVV